MSETIYCVVYRMGGTDNFTWHRTSTGTKLYAEGLLSDIRRGGRVGYVVNYDYCCAHVPFAAAWVTEQIDADPCFKEKIDTLLSSWMTERLND